MSTSSFGDVVPADGSVMVLLLLLLGTITGDGDRERVAGRTATTGFKLAAPLAGEEIAAAARRLGVFNTDTSER